MVIASDGVRQAAQAVSLVVRDTPLGQNQLAGLERHTQLTGLLFQLWTDGRKATTMTSIAVLEDSKSSMILLTRELVLRYYRCQ